MKLLTVSIILFGVMGLCKAEESLGEKTKATTNDVSRAGKKALHRTKEAICGKLTGDNKVQCLAKEAKNRIEEGKDAVMDKGTEIKNSVTNDKN